MADGGKGGAVGNKPDPVNKQASSLCLCSAKKTVHVHCACSSCNGKAVNYRTQISHLEFERNSEAVNVVSAQKGDFHSTSLQTESVSLQSVTTPDFVTEELEDEEVTDDLGPLDINHADLSPICLENMGDGTDGGSGEDRERVDISNEDEKLTYAIIKCIFEAIELSMKTGASLITFEDLLCYARHMYSRGKEIDKDDHLMKLLWPKDWEQAKKFLNSVGYEDAKEYFICLSVTHKRQWDIMESANKKCRFCGETGTINYYYLGLRSKVKLWTGDPEMCAKMTAHWSEKEHWINGSDSGWEIKKEIWDGARFSKLSWFWDPHKRWTLPARCIRDGCKNVFSAEDILQAPDQPDDSKELYCNCCYSRFVHCPKYANGDPRNIAYIGHWDGFQPFGSKRRGTGAIEVSVATMAKVDRLQTDEVFTVGFVPSYDLPDARPNSIDPFLEPLVREIETGYIEGYKVDYAGSLPNLPSGRITIRHIILLWTGDHPAQCEVCKTKGAGAKKGCRRCHICGTWISERMHNYYPEFRKQYRHPYRKRSLKEELPTMKTLEEEERPTYFQRMSKESGLNGLSVLHRLYPLYGFDVLRDTVFDAMHLLPLNIVKNNIERWLSGDYLNKKDLNTNLSKMPWTVDYRASRLPLDVDSMGYWKAEEYQKLAFPASEFILNGLLPEDELKLWAPVPRMVEFVFNSGRNGWTREMIKNFRCLAWRYCISCEEQYGTDACVVNLHNLTHLPDDIQRFSAPDNFWCFEFERAVKRYVKQSSNKKHIEKSFARRESQREFLKFQQDHVLISSQRPRWTWAKDKEKVTASSINGAKYLLKVCSGGPLAKKANQGVLIGSGRIHILSRQEQQTVLEYLHGVGVAAGDVCEAVESFRSAFLPMHCTPLGGKLYRKGDFVSAIQDDAEVFFQIQDFFLVEVKDTYESLVLGETLQLIIEPGGAVSRHPVSDTVYVQHAHSSICLGLKDLRREIMLYQDTENKYAVVDPFRKKVNLPNIVVPVYPEVGDFVCVSGEDDDLWRALVTEINNHTLTVGGFFYVKHSNFYDNGLWIRERPQRKETIHFNSIVSFVDGEWVGAAWRDTYQ